MNEKNKVLEIEGIKKKYENFTALENINFNIKSGELVVLLGPNGAGKSTLFSTIAGLITPDQGQCRINENDISERTVLALKSLGIVFQQATIDMELTIIENLLFHSRLHGLSTKLTKEIIVNELKEYNLLDKVKSKVRFLSGGERRKVELIRSLLHKPKILLMDEPTVGLDPGSRKDLLIRILKLKDEARLAVLWTTHLVDEAEKADRIIILNKGKIASLGSPKSIMKKTSCESLSKAFFKIIK